jgi:uncharacterized protein YgiB involved in biofilm formation
MGFHSPGAKLSTDITWTGTHLNTAQPAFQAQLQTSDSNVTGDGTSYRFGEGNALVERFDQGSDNNTNGTFTAPVAGKYLLGASVRLQQVATDQTEIDIRLITSNCTYTCTAIGGDATWDDANITETVLADMDADDTYTLTVLISNGSKVVDVLGHATVNRMWGVLVC